MNSYNNNGFQKLWDLHHNWSIGVLYKEIIKTLSSNIYLSDISGGYYNFAVPSVDNPELLDLPTIEKIFKNYGEKSSFLLFSSHQDNGFVEHLIRQGYKSAGGDCWLTLDKGAYKNPTFDVNIAEITPETFYDFYSVLSKVFVDFPGNGKYLELCLKSIKKQLSSPVEDLDSKLYVIYDGNTPTAGGGVFYSTKNDIAYIHNGGTLKEFRGKGYQTALLKHRINIALNAGISNIYTSVEPHSQSWSNCIKIGFTQFPWSLLLTKEQ